MTFGPSGLGVTNYLGVTAPTPPNFVTALRNPDQNDYFNFNVGDLWLNMSSLRQVPSIPPTAEDVFMLVSKSAHVATWVNFAGGAGSVETLTGNTGGAVGPLANNINVVGDGTTITIAGNPGTHTLTASAIGTGIMSALQPDIGGVVHPIGGVINIHNTDTNVVTSNGGTNNLNVNLANNLNIVNNVVAGGEFVSNSNLTNFYGDGLGSMGLQNNIVSAQGPNIGFLKTRALGAALLNDSLGAITFAGYTGTVGVVGAQIVALAAGNFSGTSAPGLMQFSTTPVGSTATLVRATLQSTGVLTLAAADAGATTLQVTGGISSITSFGQAGNGSGIALLIDNTGLLCTIASSIKYKENIEDLGDFSDIVYDLKPKKFNFKKEPNVKAWGLIAEEVAEIFPEIVSYDENYEPQSIKYHELTVLLLNELQKLNKRVKLLEESLGD